MQHEQGITGDGGGLDSDKASLTVESTVAGATSGEMAEAEASHDDKNVLQLNYRPEATALQVEGLANCTLHVSSYDRLSKEEIDAIQEFHKTIFDGTETFRNFHKNTPTLFTFAKDENNNIIAFGLVRNYPSFTMPAFTPEKRTFGVCVIESIATRHGWRKKGLSRKILDKIFAELAQNTMSTVTACLAVESATDSEIEENTLRSAGLALDSLIVLIEVRDPDGLGKRALAVAQEYGFKTATGKSAELVTNYSAGRIVLDLTDDFSFIEFRIQRQQVLHIGDNSVPSQMVEKYVYQLPSEMSKEVKNSLMLWFASWKDRWLSSCSTDSATAVDITSNMLTGRSASLSDLTEQARSEFLQKFTQIFAELGMPIVTQPIQKEHRIAFQHNTSIK